MSGVPLASSGQLRLTLLGQLDLRRADGTEVRAVVQQPKRLALLAYMTLAGRGAWKRRDTLLGLFWPELDQEHARGALRRSLYFLRVACGPSVLVSRGEDDLAIGEDLLWCDARAFEEALDAERTEDALRLYRGDLLEGFFIAGAPDAERWLDGERQRLRARAVSAAWAQAERAPGDEAVRWARHAMVLQPDDEHGLRRLMQVLERHGNASSALRAFADYEARLGQEGLSCTPETKALAERLRARAPAAATAAHRNARTADPSLIAIVPFLVRGDAALRYLGEGMVDLLSNALDGAGTLRASDPRAVLAAAQAEVGSSDAGDAETLGAELGAGWVVTGTIVVASPRLRIAVSLHRTGEGAQVRTAVEAPDEASLFQAVDALARELVAAMSQAPTARPSLLAARTSASWTSLKAYLQGEQAFRLGQHSAADEAFARAVQVDPDFSLAWYRLASVRAALAQVGAARVANAEAMRQPQRLAPHVRAMLEAQAAWLNGRLGEAERRYAAVVADHPEDVEARYLLGDVLFHGNPYRGRSPQESAQVFRQVLAADSTHPAALAKLARLAALEGDRALFGTYLDALAKVNPEGEQTIALRAVRALEEDRVREVGAVVLWLRAATIVSIARVLGYAALHATNLAPVERIGAELVRRVHSPELRAFGLLLLADGALAQGNWSRAEERWAEARTLDGAWTLAHRTLRVLHADSPAPPDLLPDVQQDLLAWNAGDEPTRVAHPLALHDGLQRHIRCYLLGLAGARAGDLADAARWAEELSELGIVEGAEAVIERMQRMLEATRRLLHDDLPAALQALDGARTDVWFQHAVASPIYAGAETRLLRGMLLARLGRHAEAVGWLTAIGQHSPWELALRVPALHLAGQISEMAGDAAAARGQYLRARRQLTDPDAAFARIVGELEGRLARLGATG